MFLSKTKLKTGLLLLAVLFTAASCGGGGGGGQAVELVWWKPFDDPRFIEPLIQEFQKTHPNVRVKYVQKNIETYEDEVLQALAAGNGPDIFSIRNDWLPKHQDKLVPAGATGPGLREFKEQFASVASADLLASDKVYAVPLSIDVLALYYNRDLLSSAGVARPPATWEELVAMTPKLTRQDAFGNFTKSAAAMGTSGNVNRAPDLLGLLMLQNGTPFYSPAATGGSIDQQISDGKSQSYSPGERALQFYTQFANPAKVTYTWNARSNNSVEAFGAGQVAMVLSYSYLRDQLADRAPFLNYAVAPAPQISLEGTRVNYANYWAEAVAKQGKHQDAAWQFLKFISQKDVLKKYYEAQKAPSSRIDLLEEQQSDPAIGVFAESALSARSFYKPDSAAVESIFVQAIDDVTLKSVSPAEAIKAAGQKMRLLLRNF